MHENDAPPYGSAADGDTLGVRHVEVALRDLPFPLTGAELAARAGRWRIPITGQRSVELRELLDLDERRTYRSAEDVARRVARQNKGW